MLKIDLPLLSGAATISEALQAMDAFAAFEGAPVAAVVVDVGPIPRVLFVGDLDAANRSGVTLLRDVPGYELLYPPVYLPALDATRMPVVEDISVDDVAESFAGKPGGRPRSHIDWLAVPAPFIGTTAGSTASVVTQYETTAYQLFRRLTCEGDPPHRFPKPVKEPGNQCPECLGPSLLSYR